MTLIENLFGKKEEQTEITKLTPIDMKILEALSGGGAVQEGALFSSIADTEFRRRTFHEQGKVLIRLDELGLINYFNPQVQHHTQYTNRTHAAITKLGMIFIRPACPLPIDRQENTDG